jgi:hypothetical protein
MIFCIMEGLGMEGAVSGDLLMRGDGSEGRGRFMIPALVLDGICDALLGRMMGAVGLVGFDGLIVWERTSA